MEVACSFSLAPGSLLKITHFLFDGRRLNFVFDSDISVQCSVCPIDDQIYVVLFSGGAGGGGGLRDNYGRPTQMRGYWDAPKSKDDSRWVCGW